MRHIEIRQCEARDLNDIAQLEMDWQQEGITYGFVASHLEDLQNHSLAYCLVATCNDLVVGFIRGSEHVSDGLAVIPEGESYLEIDDVYIKPSFRNDGIGSKLVSRLKVVAKENGIQRFLIYSSTKDLDRVVKFYRNMGFESWCVQMFI